MKKIVILIFLILCYKGYSQSLSVFKIDTSAFPIITASFYALDVNGNQIINLLSSEFQAIENGNNRSVLSVSCSVTNDTVPVSIALSIDASTSMGYSNFNGNPMQLAKTTASILCNKIFLPTSELALQSCTDKASIIQDWTTDRQKITNNITPIIALGNNDFEVHLLDTLTGLLNVAKTGKYKKNAIIFTDAWCDSLPVIDLQKCIDTCKKYNITFYAVIYSQIKSEPNGIKLSLQRIAEATGGALYDDITSIDAAKKLAYILQMQTQLDNPCEIKWNSKAQCSTSYITTIVNLIINNTKDTTTYFTPQSSIARLDISPSNLYFKNKTLGKKYDTIITVTAINSDFTVNNIASINPLFSISPTSLYIKAGESRTLTVSYTPIDSNNSITKITFVNNLCTAYLYAQGGFLFKKVITKDLKLTYPNGGEKFVIGSDSVITWEGVLPSDSVKLEYSIDKGVNWITLAEKATGLSWTWKNIPLPESNQCLIKVSTLIPVVEWQKCYGGSNDDEAYSIQQTSDGGYIVAGSTQSNDGDVTGKHGISSYSDYWIVKLKNNGDIEWQKCLGGSAIDDAYSIQETNDSGFVVAGRAGSSDGDIVGHIGDFDYWILKLSNSGNEVWQKCLGGSSSDQASAIYETNDGGYIVGGNSWSNNIDISSHYGTNNTYDYWIAKLKNDRTIEWQRSLGGTGDDFLTDIKQTSDGGFIATGYSNSNDSNVSGNHGLIDYWVVKLTNLGVLKWQKCLGGSLNDFSSSIQETSDGGYIISGKALSNDGDVTENHGSSDCWLVKLTSDGNLEWQKCFGGSNDEEANSVQITNDDGYIVAGYANSKDGDLIANHGNSDFWIIKLTSDANIEWQKILGGSSYDYANSIQRTNDGGYIVAGYTYSKDRDVTGNHGGSDFWIIKLSAVESFQQDISDSTFAIVKPNIICSNFDFGNVYINEKKDSVAIKFLQNIGTCPCQIDTIYITGANANQFNFVNYSYPFVMTAGEAQNVEFKFNPTSIGLKSAKITVITQTDTIYANISGVCIRPLLTLSSEVINFDSVRLGAKRDSIVTAIIEVVGTSNITITGIKFIGPDSTDFRLIGGSTDTSFVLSPLKKVQIPLQFMPSYVGRANGHLKFYYIGQMGDLEVQLFGTGFIDSASAILYTGSATGYPGDAIEIPILLTNYVNVHKTGAFIVNTQLSFNSTLLVPTQEPKGIISNGIRTITYDSLPILTISDTLTKIKFIACLGNDSVTAFSLTNDTAIGGHVTLKTEDGTFTLLGICKEGSPRLINPNGKTTLNLVKPNPTSDKLDIEFTLRENTNTELYIVNLQGEKVMRIIDNTMETGNYKRSIDLQGLASGVYNIILKTPNDIKSKYFEILK